MTEFLQSEVLTGLDGIAHGFFTRRGGVSEGTLASLNCGGFFEDAPEKIAENRARVAKAVGVRPDRLLSLYQIHSPDVQIVTEPWALDDRPRADAMVTKERGIALGILTADCGPLLFADPQAGVIGAAHAGWRGAVGGVIEATIEAMLSCGAKRANIRAAIGPCIWKDSYEVGVDFPAPFLTEDPANAACFSPAQREGHLQFDLPAYLYRKVSALGLGAVTASPADTCADAERFFSYRRSTLAGTPDYGRLISVISLPENPLPAGA